MDAETLKKMAHLSRLELSDAESNQLGKDLGKVLNFFNQIAEVNTKGVEPMVTPVEIESYLREDEKIMKLKLKTSWRMRLHVPAIYLKYLLSFRK